MEEWFAGLWTVFLEEFELFKLKFINNFVVDNRWHYLTDGLLVTLEVTFFAVIIGIILGFSIAVVRSSADKNTTPPAKGFRRFFYYIFRFSNWLCKLYLTVIRGTPVVVQLLIIYFVIFASADIDKVLAAVVAFGLNSAAYVAEIIRGGIMSVDNGQFEAGRSLGFGYVRTMIYIILPQAFKNVLPALANEFIVLLKETSVSGYIALADLTRGGNIIMGRTFDAFMPLVSVALIYLVIVILLSKLVGLLERRLRSSER